ncbi:zinc-ribbon domain-containing protein [Alicyclobacillus curvatus]|nr:zinc-ribbon domain-containing protein [Alicyclobacillus curvatus]
MSDLFRELFGGHHGNRHRGHPGGYREPSRVYERPASITRCPECGRENDVGNNFCAHCGTSLKPKQKSCPNCSKTAPPGASSCPNCGQKF